MGYHVTKRGTRFAALEPLSLALTDIYGSVRADVARGLALRLDHGSQYLADHFQNQIRYWGIAPSFAFVEEPQTNGCAERFIRTFKEQAVLRESVPQPRGRTGGRGRLRRDLQHRVAPGEAWVHDAEGSPGEPRTGLGSVGVMVCPGGRARYNPSNDEAAPYQTGRDSSTESPVNPERFRPVSTSLQVRQPSVL